eukprot:403354531
MELEHKKFLLEKEIQENSKERSFQNNSSINNDQKYNNKSQNIKQNNQSNSCQRLNQNKSNKFSLQADYNETSLGISENADENQIQYQQNFYTTKLRKGSDNFNNFKFQETSQLLNKNLNADFNENQNLLDRQKRSSNSQIKIENFQGDTIKSPLPPINIKSKKKSNNYSLGLQQLYFLKQKSFNQSLISQNTMGQSTFDILSPQKLKRRFIPSSTKHINQGLSYKKLGTSPDQRDNQSPSIDDNRFLRNESSYESINRLQKQALDNSLRKQNLGDIQKNQTILQDKDKLEQLLNKESILQQKLNEKFQASLNSRKQTQSIQSTIMQSSLSNSNVKYRGQENELSQAYQSYDPISITDMGEKTSQNSSPSMFKSIKAQDVENENKIKKLLMNFQESQIGASRTEAVIKRNSQSKSNLSQQKQSCIDNKQVELNLELKKDYKSAQHNNRYQVKSQLSIIDNSIINTTKYNSPQLGKINETMINQSLQQPEFHTQSRNLEVSKNLKQIVEQDSNPNLRPPKFNDSLVKSTISFNMDNAQNSKTIEVSNTQNCLKQIYQHNKIRQGQSKINSKSPIRKDQTLNNSNEGCINNLKIHSKQKTLVPLLNLNQLTNQNHARNQSSTIPDLPSLKNEKVEIQLANNTQSNDYKVSSFRKAKKSKQNQQSEEFKDTNIATCQTELMQRSQIKLEDHKIDQTLDLEFNENQILIQDSIQIGDKKNLKINQRYH